MSRDEWLSDGNVMFGASGGCKLSPLNDAGAYAKAKFASSGVVASTEAPGKGIPRDGSVTAVTELCPSPDVLGRELEEPDELEYEA
jgi:hypothetical protein